MVDAPWHRRAVGGKWEVLGRLQFDFMVAAGLRPEHYLLDIGCGSLRGGRHFIPYLEPGHYFGIDRNPELLRLGRENELDAEVMAARRPVIEHMADFGFERLGQRFDFALAVSVFTHLPLNSLMRCLVNAARVLGQDARFYATFFENSDGKRNVDPIVHERGGVTTYYDADPYHYDLETIRCACNGTGLAVDYLGQWDHPLDQRMLLFTPA